jgi:hypothetical protein
MAKHEKKLSKEIIGNIVKITELVTNKVMEFDVTKLPKEIQAKLPAFAITHKLGDAAAGDAGQEAVDSIMKTWEGLMAGNWAVRVPKGESVSMSALNSGIEKLPPKEAEAARALLLKLGIIKAPAK